MDQTRREFIAAAAAASLPAFIPLRDIIRGELSASIDDDLLELTIARLGELYAAKKYTVTQVTRWYLDRIARYDGIYRALIHVDTAGALAAAARLDAEATRSSGTTRGAMWGVPIVIKANTSIKGLVTSAGWWGYVIPGHELIAPTDATIVAKLKAAGVVILGQTNMPDFAASDTNFSSAFGRTGNAYDVRFSPGGSSGGTVTAVTANFALLGNGTDTGNSIRMPSATSSVVGVLPTRGLVSIAGIHPLDWLRDNTGPIARTVTDAAIALGVMAGEDPKDFRTKGSSASAQTGPYTKYLKADALSGKRFGVPSFILNGHSAGPALQPDSRELFMKAVDELRAAGATVLIDDAILPDSFAAMTNAINTGPYSGEGTETFLRDFGPAEYHSAAEYALAVGAQLPVVARGGNGGRTLETDPDAENTFWGPQRRAVAAYDEGLDRLRLDGYVYPAIQMPPNDETSVLRAGGRSGGPHSATAWVNPLGVPAVSVPAGFYANGMPFGLELSAKRWKDGDLLGWAFGYEQATKHRKPPTLVERR
jgi:Asp-tRNA(Asn)/Glu-tRNA(Gln) amidotransferase A subunit family amidase